MTILLPETSAVQNFQIRTRPSASFSAPFSCSLLIVDEDTNISYSITPLSAVYNTNDFLVVSASIYLTGSHFYTIQVFQESASVLCSELYRGELLPTTQSATVRDSKPLLSFYDSSNDYIIYEG